MKPGILGYGASIPDKRIKIGTIADVWGKEGERISSGLGVFEKAVAAWDEDSCTLAVEAARTAVECAKIDSQKIGAVFVGSESKPYAVKPTATIVAEAIGATPNLTAADFEFACKAGTAAIQACMGMVSSGMIEAGVAIGADTAQARPNDALEYSAGSGGAAFVIGKEKPIAEIQGTYSFTTDTPDFWRRQHALYPRHAGRFTGEPAYFKHVLSCAKGIMERTGTEPKDFDYAVFHQPNGKFPVRAAKILGFSEKQFQKSLVTPFVGNTYSGSSLLGLCSVLDEAKDGQLILLVSYGSGAGSDGFVLKTTKHIEESGRKPLLSIRGEIEREKEYVSYAEYAKNRRKLKL